MSRSALITGAGGFIGSALAAALLARGWQLAATDAAFDAPTRARLRGARLTEAPLPEGLAALSDLRPDVVIHAAAITASPAKRGESRAAHACANTALTLAALEHARAAGAGRFVFLSSSGVFGDAAPADAAPVDETSAATATDAYSAAKRAAEILLQGAAEPGFATLSLRLGPVFGPHEAARPSRPRTSLVDRMIAEARAAGTITLTTPDARRDWTYLPDLTRVVADLLAQPAAGAGLLHATSGQVLTDRALARTIAALISGTRVIDAPDPAAPPPRPPMVSTATALRGVVWTDPAAALAALLQPQGAPA